MHSRLLVLSFLLGACTIPRTVDALGEASPPAEFGRPTWVRVSAGVGAWAGGIVGGAVSIVLLPVTWPLGQIAGDSLGEQGGDEFLLFPAVGGAAFGHALLGAPADGVDWVFRRAWVGSPDPVTSYDFVPLEGPAKPKAK
ncbi:MAG: hypothetical protein JNK15_07865 [Planctomycetes bacterium]|nr:hypothetical protein [Planctomycetota bacterium]